MAILYPYYINMNRKSNTDRAKNNAEKRTGKQVHFLQTVHISPQRDNEIMFEKGLVSRRILWYNTL